ncbi:chromate transporter [Endozoicomonas montiporae]|uniref:chromate transporter n=1 Tax=Endozoicomonas montiporae TaxID=1027273 RepID=UPI00068B4008|nr:chromate transporter [Endozoicomonas montiporae]
MLLKLFLTFFRLGAVTFGGGYAMMALLEQELVEKNDWMSGDELLEITAIAQITPGTIAINAATFVGRRMAGIPGAVTASTAVVLPPLIIVGFLASYLPVWLAQPWLQGAFLGMRYAVAALIFHAAVKMLCSNVTTTLGRALFAAAFAALLFTPVHPLLMILAGGAAGIGLYVGNALPGQNKVVKGSQ